MKRNKRLWTLIYRSNH